MNSSHSLVSGIKGVLDKKGWVEIPSSGVSMYPLIKEGDICRFIPIGDLNTIQKGEVLLYVSEEGRLIGHRFYRSDKCNSYILKGDTNDLADPPVMDAQLIGRLALIKKRHICITSEGIIARMWGAIVLTCPAVPRWCKKISFLKSRLRVWVRNDAYNP